MVIYLWYRSLRYSKLQKSSFCWECWAEQKALESLPKWETFWGDRNKEDDHLLWLSVQCHGQIRAEAVESWFWQVAEIIHHTQMSHFSKKHPVKGNSGRQPGEGVGLPAEQDLWTAIIDGILSEFRQQRGNGTKGEKSEALIWED